MKSNERLRLLKGPGGGAPTDWSVVERAKRDGPERRAAFTELYATYYPYLYRDLRSKGLDPLRADECVQEFFAKLFGGERRLRQDFAGVTQERGSFRGWLRTVNWRQVLNALKFERAKKRGGGAMHLEVHHPLAQAVETPSLPLELPTDECAKRLVVRRAYEQLRREYATPEERAFVDNLYHYLRGEEGARSAEFCAMLQTNDNNLRQRRHQMRRRLRGHLIQEASELFGDSECIEDDLRRLALLE